MMLAQQKKHEWVCNFNSSRVIEVRLSPWECRKSLGILFGTVSSVSVILSVDFIEWIYT